MRVGLLAAAVLVAFPLARAVEASAAPPQEQKRGYHMDERYGFKLRFPKKWQMIPIKLDEGWLVSSYLSDRTYFYTDKNDGWTWDHKPEMQVIAFVDQEEMAEITKEEGKITIEWKNPYKDYKEYLRGTYSGGGFYVSEEETDEVNDIKVTKLEIKVEKLARTGPKRIITWIYEAPGVDFAVQFEVLEGAYKKLEKTMTRSLKSFELIPRTKGGLPARQTGGTSVVITDKDEEAKKTPEERRKERIEENRVLHAKAMSAVPPGWTAKKIGAFLVISHVDDKYSKRIVDQLTALLTWLDKNMGYYGPGEYVREPIIRICKDYEEEKSFRKGNWWSFGGEIVTHKDLSDGHNSFEQQYVKRRVLQLWMQDRDPELYLALPQWIDRGLDKVIEGARFKGNKVEFRPDDWERDQLRESQREGATLTPRDLIRMSAENFFEGNSWREYEAAALVRFLIAGTRNKKFKAVFPDYLQNLKAVITEIEAEEAEKGKVDDPEPQTEEEEEEAFKNKRNAWREKEQEVLERVWARTFSDWTDKDWTAFEKAYDKFAK